MATYVLSSTASDLTGGADYSGSLVTSGAGTAGFSFSVAAATTETSYAWTPAGVPGTAGRSGGYTVEVNITTGSTVASLSVSVSRVNSAGTAQATSAATAEQAGTAGAKTFAVDGAGLGTWASGDRLRVNYIWRGTHAMNAATLAISTGDTNSEVIIRDGVSSLTDSFETLDTAKWTASNDAGVPAPTVTSGELVLATTTGATAGYSRVTSVGTYDLANSSFVFKFVSDLGTGLAAWEAGLRLLYAPNEAHRLEVASGESGNLAFTRVTSDAGTTVASTAFSPGMWVRVREGDNAGTRTIYCDTAPSTASNPPVSGDWTNLGSFVKSNLTWPVDNMRPVFIQGHGATTGTASSSFKVDGVNAATSSGTAVGADLAGAYGIVSAVGADGAGSYAVVASVGQDSAGSYAVLNAAGQDQAGAYAVVAAVGADQAGSYGIVAAVGADSSGSYGIQETVGQNSAGSYAVIEGVGQDLAGTYSVVSAVGQDSTGSYGIAGTVSADASGAYAIVQAVGADGAGTYAVVAAVGQDLSGSYVIEAIGAVGNDLAGAYGIVASVGADAAGSYGVVEAVGQDQGGAYLVVEAVGADQAGAYAVATVAGADMAGAYVIAQAVGQDQAGAYATVDAVGSDSAQAYAVLAVEGADQSGAYSIAAAVGQDLAGAYGVAGQVGQDIAGSYGITATVISDSAGEYRVLVSVTADSAGGYTMFEAAGADLVQAYAVAAHVASELAGGYSVAADTAPAPFAAIEARINRAMFALLSDAEATLAGATVVGMFEDGYAHGAVGTVGLAGSQPVFMLPTASITGEAVGQLLVANATTYIVGAHEPDGTGVSRLFLERA